MSHGGASIAAMLSPAPLVFIDTETTGLHPHRRKPWDIYMIRRETDGTEHEVGIMIADVDLTDADDYALRLGRYYERHPDPSAVAATPGDALADLEEDIGDHYDLLTATTAAIVVSSFTAGAHLVGACPWFDAQHLAELIYQHKLAPRWHHRMIDVYSMLNGATAQHWPNPRDAMQHIGFSMAGYDTHTAQGDTYWVRDLYDHLTKPQD